MGVTISLFLILVVGSIAAIYALGLQPRTRRQWVYLAITIGFLVWMLPFMASLR